MGVVFRATDLALDRPVALKLIAARRRAPPVFRARFEDECRAAARSPPARRPGVPRRRGGRGPLVTMRYVEGTHLGAPLAEGRARAGARGRVIVEVAGRARRGARPRPGDRRQPTNVLIAGRDGAEHVFLTDFGLTSGPRPSEGLTRPGSRRAPRTTWRRSRPAAATSTAAPTSTRSRCVLFKPPTGTAPFDGDSDVEKMVAAPERSGAVAARRAARPAGRALDAGGRARAAKAARSGPSPWTRSPRPCSAAIGEDPRPRRRAAGATRVIVAEDAVLLREGLVRLLTDEGFDVVAEAGDAQTPCAGAGAPARPRHHRHPHPTDEHRRGAARGAGRARRAAGDGGARALPVRRRSATRSSCWATTRPASATCSSSASPIWPLLRAVEQVCDGGSVARSRGRRAACSAGAGPTTRSRR